MIKRYKGIGLGAFIPDPDGDICQYDDHLEEIARRDAFIEEQRETLRFYGDKESYVCPSPRHYFTEPVLKDGGRRAREALKYRIVV